LARLTAKERIPKPADRLAAGRLVCGNKKACAHRKACANRKARADKKEGPVIKYDEAEFAVEDEPLISARRSAEDLGGTEPVTPATGAVLRFFATAIAARAVVELGTGCGTSGIWLLRGMRPGGVLTSVDPEPEYQRLARKAFAHAGFAANQARLIVGRALDVLPRLSDGAYDLVFCDADQLSYPEYLMASLRLLRPGGIVVFNNTLPQGDGPGADGARELADMIRIDERLVPLLLPIADGLLAGIKK
jgi:predicted O-methyltransferase YrrM